MTETANRKQVIVFPRGTLDAKAKELLSKNGYIAIEADDPSAVRLVLPTTPMVAPIAGDEVVNAMIQALSVNEQRAQSFGVALLRIMKGAS